MRSSEVSVSNGRFRQFAWAFLAYLVLVILFGAWVRISGSGNGCGSHWPTCHGQVLPQAPETKTLIEFTHRVTSALCGALGLALIWMARHRERRVFLASLATMFFILVEGFIGAVLVKRELVADDASASRAIVISLHLVNTLLLTASAATVAWWSGPQRTVKTAVRGMLAAALAALVLTAMSGAVTALGDTVFPTKPVFSGILDKLGADLSGRQHFLVRLRILHPLVALAAASLVAVVLSRARRDEGFGNLPGLGLWLVAVQTAFGAINIALAAPGWMQIAHLLLSQALWVVVWITMLTAFKLHQPAGRVI